MAAQTRQVFKNLALVLEEAGAYFSNVVELTTYIFDRNRLQEHIETVNQIFPSLFPDKIYPANNLIFVHGLYREEFLLEVKAIAVQDWVD